MRDKFAKWVARHLPYRVLYWGLIDVGVRYIACDEEVPAVPFTVVLQRYGLERR